MRKPVDMESVEAFLHSHERIEEPRLLKDGQVVGEWVVRAFLGRGGSGEVYRAEHRYVHIASAIKILFRDDAATKNRFSREAQILSTIQNPAFPKFYSFGEVDGRSYLVIELLEHYPSPQKDAEVAKYLLKICEGVSCLHQRGFVHRDIKPQNILRRPGTDQPVLIDLGLVKDVTLAPAHEGISLSIVDGKAVGVGTPRYAAPEQFSGGDISPTADIHALGMLANECFGGTPPRCWARIIRRSTSSIPSQRYANVAQFVRVIKCRHLAHWGAFGVFVVVSVCGCAGAWLFKSTASLSPVITMVHRDAVVTNTVSAISNVQIQVVRQHSLGLDTSNRINNGDVAKGAADGRAQGDTACEDAGSELGELKDSKVIDAPAILPKSEKFNAKKLNKWPRQGSFSGDKSIGQDFW